LRGWLLELNSGGQLNALLTDGEHLMVYHDAERGGDLCWTRRVPPHTHAELSSDAVRISLESPRDPNRTALVFSSVPLSADTWVPLAPGALMIARRGSVIWNSDPRTSSLGGERTAPGPILQGQVEAGQQSAAAQPLPAPQTVPPSLSGRPSRILRISHTTRYDYERPVDRSSHRLLLRPVQDRNQTLIDYSLNLYPYVDTIEYEDVFGNAAIGVEIDAQYRQLEIVTHATVRVQAVPSLEHRTVHGRHEIPLVWMPWQRQMLSAYLLPPELPETQLNELSAFAMGFVERNDYDLVGTLLDLNETLYRDFEYVFASTTNETTAFDVFESRRGVCQDFANLMICLARLLHVPARYRMGYIYTGADYKNKIQSDASHAWVELYLPRVGWHGFDPTNGIQVGADHVRVACGRSYRDATPTSGTIYRGGGTETLTISVEVEEGGPVDT
jgi:transglutaminase-like putative cysteine protease